MLKIESNTLLSFERNRVQAHLPEISATLRERFPELHLTPTSEVEEFSRRNAALGARYRVSLLDNICRLQELEQRWGGFSDEDSRWIVEVLDGPLSEDDRLNFIEQAFFGG